MKYFCICNPIAGRGKGRAIMARLNQALADKGISIEMVETTGARHAIELARKVSAESAEREARGQAALYEAVIGVGGDGTMGEIAEGLIAGGSSLPLGCIFAGRGNDFGRSFGLANPPDGPALEQEPFDVQLETILSGHVASIDIATLSFNGSSEGYMINGFGMGATAMVTEWAEHFKKLGKLAYAAGVAMLFSKLPKPHDIEVIIDGGEPQYFATQELSLMNGRSMGGGFLLGPLSDLQDGVLELSILSRKVGRVGLASFAKKFRGGTHYQDKRIVVLKGHDIAIKMLSHSGVCHKDGELFSKRAERLSFHVQDRALKLLVPPQAALLD